jgi:hypothetical protein
MAIYSLFCHAPGVYVLRQGPHSFPGDLWKYLPDDITGEWVSSAMGGEEATNHIFMYWKNDPPSGNTNARSVPVYKNGKCRSEVFALQPPVPDR